MLRCFVERTVHSNNLHKQLHQCDWHSIQQCKSDNSQKKQRVSKKNCSRLGSSYNVTTKHCLVHCYMFLRYMLCKICYYLLLRCWNKFQHCKDDKIRILEMLLFHCNDLMGMLYTKNQMMHPFPCCNDLPHNLYTPNRSSPRYRPKYQQYMACI